MENKNFSPKLAAGILLIKDNKVLLLKRSPQIYGGGLYGFPGGHVDGNETVRQALARETLEELGIIVSPEDLKFVHVVHRRNKNGSEYITFYFSATNWLGEPFNKEPDKHDLLEWFELDNIPAEVIHVRHAIMCYRTNIGQYIEEGW